MNNRTTPSPAQPTTERTLKMPKRELQTVLPVLPVKMSLAKQSKRVIQPNSPKRVHGLQVEHQLPSGPRATSFQPTMPSHSTDRNPQTGMSDTFPLFVRRKPYSDKDCVASLFKKIYGTPLSQVMQANTPSNAQLKLSHDSQLTTESSSKSKTKQKQLKLSSINNFDLSVEAIRKQRLVTHRHSYLTHAVKAPKGSKRVPDFKALAELKALNSNDFDHIFSSQLIKLTPI